MPLTSKGKKILSSMRKQYGGEKGERVFYASINKGKVTGAEKSTKRAEGGPVDPLLEEARRRGKQSPVIQSMQNIARERRQMQMPPTAEARARGGRVDAHEAREMQMMREMMQMHPGMAKGGAAGNGAYMVGERGPEMFMPDRPGTIIPHHELTRLARKYGGHVGSHMRAEGGSVKKYTPDFQQEFEATAPPPSKIMTPEQAAYDAASPDRARAENEPLEEMHRPMKRLERLARARGGRVSNKRKR